MSGPPPEQRSVSYYPLSEGVAEVVARRERAEAAYRELAGLFRELLERGLTRHLQGCAALLPGLSMHACSCGLDTLEQRIARVLAAEPE